MANPNTDETQPAGGTGGPGDLQSPSGVSSGPPAPPPAPGSQVTDDDKKWLDDTYNKLFGRPPSAAEAADLQRMHDIHGSDASNYRDYYASQVLGPRSNNAPGTGAQGTAINYGNYNPKTGQGSPNQTAAYTPPSPYTPDTQNQLREWDKLFVQHLGRHLTSADVTANWNPKDAMPSVEAIRASILASPEYKTVSARGGPTTPPPPGTPTTGTSGGGGSPGPALFDNQGNTTLAGQNWFSDQMPGVYQPFEEEFHAPDKPQGINDVWNRGFTAPRVTYDAQGNRQIMHGNYLANVGGGPQSQPGAAGATGATPMVRDSASAQTPISGGGGFMYDPKSDPQSPQYDPAYAQTHPGEGGTTHPSSPQTRSGLDQATNASVESPNMPGFGPQTANGQPAADGQQLSDFESVDPGYDFRIKEAQKAMERGAAARGTLLTGGTQKAIGNNIQDYASNEYQNIYNRDLGEYGAAYGIFGNERANKQGTYADDYNRAMTEYMNRYQIGSQNQLNKIGSQRNNMLDAFGMATQNRQLSDAEQAQAFDIWNTLDTNYFNRLFNVSNSGLNAGGALGGMGSQIADYLTQLGNARAAGTVGAGNAYGGALSNIGQNVWLPSIIGQQRT